MPSMDEKAIIPIPVRCFHWKNFNIRICNQYVYISPYRQIWMLKLLLLDSDWMHHCKTDEATKVLVCTSP